MGEREREREDAGSFRFTIQFAAPRNLIKRFYVYYGQFYMCVYPRHIRFARHRPTSRPSIIHKFHPLLGFLAFPSSKSRPLSNEPRKKEKKKISNLSKEETTVFLFFFFTFYERLLVSGILVSSLEDFTRAPHTREPDVCVPPLYDRFTRMGSTCIRTGASFRAFSTLPGCSTHRVLLLLAGNTVVSTALNC